MHCNQNWKIEVIKSITQLCVGQQLTGNRNHKEIVSELD